MLSSRLVPLAVSTMNLSTRFRSLWMGSSSAQLQAAEARVLSRVRTPFTQRLVDIDHGLHINTIHFARRQSSLQDPSSGPVSSSSDASSSPSSSSALPPCSSSPPLVLLHGFGAGLALWYGNVDYLASQVEDLYAIDMLGCGRSSRPPFTAKTTAEAEAFFVDSLEQWRAANGIDAMVLAGHSLGGYIASVYSLQHPTRVSRLILLSPVGLPERPPGADARTSSLSFPQRTLYTLLNKLWMAGVTPQHIVKAAGPYGKGFVERYVTHRFLEEARPSETAGAREALQGELAVSVDVDVDESVPAMDKPAVSDYLYQSLTAPSSGEYALSKILSPGAFAQQPLCNRLPALVTEAGGRSPPTTFVYGTHDWMDVRAGMATAQRMNEAGGAAVTVRVKDAGHQLFADNVPGFHEAIAAGLTMPSQEDGEARRRQWLQDARNRYSHLLITPE